MSAHSNGAAFLWVNKDAANFKSRDRSKVSESCARRAKHLKNWKHSKLRSSLSKTYFPWSFRPECVSFGATLSGNTRASAVAGDVSTFTIGTHQPAPWNYAMTGPDVYQQSAAKHPSELTPNTPIAREMRFLESLLSDQSYGFEVVTEYISFAGKALSGAESSSGGTPDPVAFDHDISTLAISPPNEGMNQFQSYWDHLNASCLHAQACLCESRQPTDERSEAPEAQQEEAGPGTYFPHITYQYIGNHRPGTFNSYIDFGLWLDQATDMYTTMVSTDDMVPNMDYLQVPPGQPDSVAIHQATISMDTSTRPQDRHCCNWNCQNHLDHSHRCTG
jgi:hypothetical protein